tara:strand:- start:211 stop:639 length:429 start_codon:yes stop_codon:yes gene_type:complete
MVLRIITILFPIILFGQEANMICGTWLEEKKQSHIEIYQTEDNTYEGKIVWLAEPLNEKGEIKLDKENPDKSLRQRTIQNLIIIEQLEFTEKNQWSNGSIYDARSGKTYSLNAKLEGQETLFMRGYLGFSLIGKTTRWTRIK